MSAMLIVLQKNTRHVGMSRCLKFLDTVLCYSRDNTVISQCLESLGALWYCSRGHVLKLSVWSDVSGSGHADVSLCIDLGIAFPRTID